MLWMDKLIQELKMDDLFFQLWKKIYNTSCYIVPSKTYGFNILKCATLNHEISMAYYTQGHLCFKRHVQPGLEGALMQSHWACFHIPTCSLTVVKAGEERTRGLHLVLTSLA